MMKDSCFKSDESGQLSPNYELTNSYLQGEHLKGEVEQLSMELEEISERFKETTYQVGDGMVSL